MKSANNNGHTWISASLFFLGLGALALAVFWIRKCRSSSVQKHEYSALRTDAGEKPEQQPRTGTFLLCKTRLANNERYELKTQLGGIGSRTDKHWFTIQDKALRAERLLTLIPIPSICALNPCSRTRDVLLDLFQTFQHPYIHPILDIEFWDSSAALVSPLSPTGSLKDLIYGSPFHEEFDRKYNCRGEALPLRMVQCLGRQILEALLFLQSRGFPPFNHLHSGNVIIQHGVARLAALENTLLDLLPRSPSSSLSHSFGYLLFEMSAGYALRSPPTPAHLQLELDRVSKVADVLSFIFQDEEIPTLEEIVCCDLFRGVELRELRGANAGHVMSGDVMDLMDLVKRNGNGMRRKDVVVMIEDRRLEDILEEDNEDSDSNSSDNR